MFDPLQDVQGFADFLGKYGKVETGDSKYKGTFRDHIWENDVFLDSKKIGWLTWDYINFHELASLSYTGTVPDYSFEVNGLSCLSVILHFDMLLKDPKTGKRGFRADAHIPIPFPACSK